MVGRGGHSNRNPDVQISTEAQKPQASTQILEQVHLWQHLASTGKSQSTNANSPTTDSISRTDTLPKGAGTYTKQPDRRKKDVGRDSLATKILHPMAKRGGGNTKFFHKSMVQLAHQSHHPSSLGTRDRNSTTHRHRKRVAFLLQKSSSRTPNRQKASHRCNSQKHPQGGHQRAE
jgi:hypothetical protein